MPFTEKKSNELSRFIFKTVNSHCLQFLDEYIKIPKWLTQDNMMIEKGKIDSVCIDEGFGSLDDESRMRAIGILQELAGNQRMTS